MYDTSQCAAFNKRKKSPKHTRKAYSSMTRVTYENEVKIQLTKTFYRTSHRISKISIYSTVYKFSETHTGAGPKHAVT